jgi:hypothetical protein
MYNPPMYSHAPGYLSASRALQFFRISVLSLPFALSVNGATFDAQGTNLTVTSDKLQVSFAGADVVGISNQLTGESYLRNPSPKMQLDLTLTQAPSQALAASGPWTVDSSGASASLTLIDSNRTVSITVSVDPATQEVVVNLDGKAQQGGVQRLNWWVTGFDLTAGKFILPAEGGLSLTSKTFSAQSSYYFSLTNLGSHYWEAPLSLFSREGLADCCGPAADRERIVPSSSAWPVDERDGSRTDRMETSSISRRLADWR